MWDIHLQILELKEYHMRNHLPLLDKNLSPLDFWDSVKQSGERETELKFSLLN